MTASGIKSGNPALAAAGQGLTGYASSQAGRSEQNVNVSVGGNNQDNNVTSDQLNGLIAPYVIQTPYGRVAVMTFDNITDMNNNGLVDFPEEFWGLGNRTTFRENEIVGISIGFIDNRPNNLIYKIFDENGRVINQMNLPQDWEGISDVYNMEGAKKVFYNEKFFDGWTENLGPGRYKSCLYSGNNLVVFKDFDISPDVLTASK